MDNAEDTRAYDLTVLLKDEEVAFLEELIRNSGGSGLDRDIQKMNFAYEINGHEQGFMAVLKFWVESNNIPTLEDALRADQRVLRYLLLRDRLKEKNKSSSGEDRVQREEVGSSDSGQDKKDKRLTNEAIEEKIEEMQG